MATQNAPTPYGTHGPRGNGSNDGGDTWFGHPRGLSTLFFTEMWERFSYYGMRAILVLFMTAATVAETPGLGISTGESAAIYGLYTFFAYVLTLPGGWVADRLWGQRRAVFVGGVIIMLGHISLAIPATPTFYIGLALVVMGTGLLKPNVSTMVGELYPEGGGRRDAGFSVFYMGINIGAFSGPIVVGLAGKYLNYHWAFSMAAFGMLAGLIQYKLGASRLGGVGELRTADSPSQLAKRARRFYAATAVCVGVVVAVALALKYEVIGISIEAIASILGASVALLAVAFFSQLILGTRWTVGFFGVALLGLAIGSATIEAEPFIEDARSALVAEAKNDRLMVLKGEADARFEAGEIAEKPTDEELEARIDMGAIEASVTDDAAKSRGVLDRNLRAYQYGIGASIILFLLVCAARFLRVAPHEEVVNKRLFVIFWIFLLSAIFWMGFEQAGSSMNLFARDLTDRVVFGWEVPTEWLQSVNSFFIILLAPVFGAIWIRLAKRNANPSIPAKFAYGLFGLSIGFFVLAWGAAQAEPDAETTVKVGMSWLVVTYFFHTAGELCLSPVGLSSITKLSPPDRVGQMMGVWFIGAALGNLLAGLAAAQLENRKSHEIFSEVAMVVGIAGIVALLVSKPVKRLIGNVQ